MRGEQYSREAYSAAEQAAQEEKRDNQNVAHNIVKGRRSAFDEFIGVDTLIDMATSDRAAKRLKALHERGQREAAELNRRYDELREKAGAAMAELARFEREELGITSGVEGDAEQGS